MNHDQTAEEWAALQKKLDYEKESRDLIFKKSFARWSKNSW